MQQGGDGHGGAPGDPAPGYDPVAMASPPGGHRREQVARRNVDLVDYRLATAVRPEPEIPEADFGAPPYAWPNGAQEEEDHFDEHKSTNSTRSRGMQMVEDTMNALAVKRNSRTSRTYKSPSGLVFNLFARRWVLLAIISYTGLTNNMLFNGFGGISTEAAAYFGVSVIAINTLVSIGFFLVMLSTFPAMWVVDKLGILNGYVIGVGINVVGAWIRYVGSTMETPTGYWILLAGQVLVSIATPFVTSLPAPLAARWFAPDEQAIVNAIGGVMQFAGFAGGLVLGVQFQDSIAFYVFLQALLQTVQIFGILLIRDRPPIPPGPKAEAVPFEFMKASRIILGNSNAVRLLLALGFLVVPWATYFSLLDQVSPPATHAQRGTIAMLMFFAGVFGAAVAGVIMDKTNAYIGMARVLGAIGLVNFVIMGFAWLYDVGPLVWISSLALGGFGMPFVPMSIELNIEFTYTPGFNLEASITGFVTVVSNFFSFFGLYLSDPEVLGFPNKYIGFVWCAFIYAGVAILFTLKPDYRRQEFLKQADEDYLKKRIANERGGADVRQASAVRSLEDRTLSLELDSEDGQSTRQIAPAPYVDELKYDGDAHGDAPPSPSPPSDYCGTPPPAHEKNMRLSDLYPNRAVDGEGAEGIEEV